MSSELLQRLTERDHVATVMAASGIHGDLVRVEAGAMQTAAILSDLYRVRLAWATPRADLPETVVLKVVRKPGNGAREQLFYREVAPSLGSEALPHCHGSGTDAVTGCNWLLQEDLGPTHRVPGEGGLPPPPGDAEEMVAVLARLHARTMLDTRWRRHAGTAQQRLSAVDWFRGELARLLDQLGELASDGTRAMYERFAAASPRLARQLADAPWPALVHGDAHQWNFMLPRGTAGSGKLLDWDAWYLGLGTSDLAYLMALYWDRETHRRFHDRMLVRYHRELRQAGVAGYGLDELRADYRLAVLLHLRTPVERFAYGIPARIWWMQLTRVMQAIEDVGAAELLD